MSRAWMPLYVADYLSDTAHLNAAESGAYLHLIMHYWVHGSLPTTDRHLARIARMTDGEWIEARETIAAFFDADWRHGRIEAELQEADAAYARRAAAGSKGGRAARVAKTKAEVRSGSLPASEAIEASIAPSIAPAMPPTMLNQPQPQPPSSLRSEDDTTGEAKARPDVMGMLRRLWDIAGSKLCEASPDVHHAATILAWWRAGFDFEADVVPAVQAQCAKAKPNSVRTWGFFTERVRENAARRLAMLVPVDPANLAPPPAPRPAKATRLSPIAYARLKNGAAAHEFASLDPSAFLDAEPVAAEGAGRTGDDDEQARSGRPRSHDPGERRADGGATGVSGWSEDFARPRLVAVRG